MKTIAFVVVWMGEFPNYFDLWLNSCEKNSTVDFWIFTDHASSTPPRKLSSNIKIVSMTFDQVKARFQKLFDFEISLERAYKLCDYKPAYGEAFADYLGAYDFWGYCDVDLIWGDIRHFVTDEILEQNEKIFTLGHCFAIILA
jgi:hypothetical protein